MHISLCISGTADTIVRSGVGCGHCLGKVETVYSFAISLQYKSMESRIGYFLIWVKPSK